MDDALVENRILADSINNLNSTAHVDTLLSKQTLRALHKAAEYGSPEALTLLGYFYERGIGGVRRDIFQASLEYLRATRFESPWAPLMLWDLTRNENYYSMLKERMLANDPEALFLWAELEAYGFDRQLSENQSLDFLKQSAAMNCAEAMVELALHFYNGNGVSADREKATGLLSQAKEFDNREAAVRLCGMQVMSGRQTTESENVFKALTAAADSGSVLAEAMLGYCYRNGKGVSKSVPLAVELYRKAAQRGSKIAYDALKELYDEIRPKEREFRISD